MRFSWRQSTSGPRAVGVVRHRADGVVAFAPHELGDPGVGAGAQPGRADRPLRVEAAHGRLEQRDEQLQPPLATPGVRSTWSVTAFVTTSVTCGTSPATAAIVKLVEAWQCMTAFTMSAPVSSSTVRTSAGWSWTATWSSVYEHVSRSIEPRQFSSQTSWPASRSASTSVVRSGGV